MMGIRLRFSLKAVLATMAIVAVTMVLAMQYAGIRKAKATYDLTLLRWNVMVVDIEEVVEASEGFARLEASTVWITRSTAQNHHRERMKLALSDADYRIRHSCNPENLPNELQVIDVLRERVHTFAP